MDLCHLFKKVSEIIRVSGHILSSRNNFRGDLQNFGSLPTNFEKYFDVRVYKVVRPFLLVGDHES